MFNNFFCLILVLSAASVFGDFPDKIKRCSSSDTECLKKSFQDVMKTYFNGLREIDLIPFDPLRIKMLLLPKNPSSPVNLALKFIDLDVIGLKTAIVKEAKGFTFTDRSLVEVKIPNLTLKGKYVMDGNVLILPIQGEGDCVINAKNVVLSYAFDMKPVDKNGVNFSKLEHIKLQIKPQMVQFQFDNLFKGDKALGDTTNIFINENWKEIFYEIEDGITDALSSVIKPLIANVLNKTPYAVLFPEKA